jgi:hypothetical protein
MAVLTSKSGASESVIPLKERRDSRMRNYIGKEGVLKSKA